MKRKSKYGDRRPVLKKKSEKEGLFQPRHLTQRDKYSSLDNIVDGVSSKGRQSNVYVLPKVYAAPKRKEKSKEYLGSDLVFKDYKKKSKEETIQDKLPQTRTEKPKSQLKPMAEIISFDDISDKVNLVERAV